MKQRVRAGPAVMSAMKLTSDQQLIGSDLLADGRLRRALEVLNPDGEETRIVGGAVRNALLGQAPGDIDLATTMRPDEVQARVRAARIRSVPTGIEHGTVTLVVKGLALEVTTLREDVETDGRHALVRFGRDFTADAQRRDFTINALSLSTNGRVFDPVGGLADLSAGRVRFIGDAKTRIREDYLRILRFFRFHAAYGRGPLDPIGLEAAAAERHGLVRLSRERIRAETMKLLVAPSALTALAAMAETGILTLVLGADPDLAALSAALDLDHASPDPILRLAALTVRTEADVTRLRAQLRLTNAEQNRLSGMLTAATGLLDCPAPSSVLRLLFENGHTSSADALAWGYATGREPRLAAPWREAIAAVRAAARPVLPWSGTDLKARGLSGPPLGAALGALKKRWSEAAFPSDAEVLRRLFDDVVGDTLDHPAE